MEFWVLTYMQLMPKHKSIERMNTMANGLRKKKSFKASRGAKRTIHYIIEDFRIPFLKVDELSTSRTRLELIKITSNWLNKVSNFHKNTGSDLPTYCKTKILLSLNTLIEKAVFCGPTPLPEGYSKDCDKDISRRY